MRKWAAVGLFFYSIALCAQPIGTVLFTLDKVVAEQNHVSRMLTRGSILNSGDVIITGAGAQAKIKYMNGTLVSINSNSNYQVSPARSEVKDSYEATLNEGSISYSSSGQKKQGILHTPIIALAILGTEFTAQLSPPPHKLNLSIISGQVQLGDGQVLHGGYNAVISANGKVTVSPASKHHDSVNNILTTNPQLIATAASTSTITTTMLTQVATIAITCP
jgi:preprotein translocase subunit YajC